MTLPGIGKRLGALLPLPQHSTEAQEVRLQHFQGTAAFQEAFLQCLQGTAKPLEVTLRSATASQCSGRRSSSFSSTPRSSWSSPPAPSACHEASGDDLQLLQSTGMLLEVRLQFLRDRLQGTKNRLQPLRDHLQELEAHLQELHSHLQELEASPKGGRTALSVARGLSDTVFPQLHETPPLGL